MVFVDDMGEDVVLEVDFEVFVCLEGGDECVLWLGVVVGGGFEIEEWE